MLRSAERIESRGSRDISMWALVLFRSCLGLALLTAALIWPFVDPPHVGGATLADFGGGHGLDFGDLLSVPLVTAAAWVSPRRVREECLSAWRRLSGASRRREPD